MRRVLAGGVILAVMATAAPATQRALATPTHGYRGGCSFTTVNDTLPTEPFGGEDQWTGEGDAEVIATTLDTNPDPAADNSTPTPTDLISFRCNVWRNGTTNLGTILSGSGTGFASDSVGTLTFTAAENDVISICEEVIVAGDVHGSATTFNAAWCADSDRTPLIPEPVTGEGPRSMDHRPTTISPCLSIECLDGVHVGTPTDEEGDVADVEATIANGDIDYEFVSSLRIPFIAALDPTTLPEVEDAVKTTSITDDTGNVVFESRETVEAAAQAVDGSCVLNGTELQKRALLAYPPTTTPREWSDDGIDAQYTTHVYQSNWARPLYGVDWSWQVEFCQVGGAQVFDSWRLNGVGSGVTSEESAATRLAAAWKSGRDISLVEASLYAHVGSENAPVQIGGSMSQKASGVNGGSSGTRMPVKSFPEMDEYRHNTALARWDSVCKFPTTYSACGSRDYQATVLHSLYEWPRSDPGPKSFVQGFYYKRRCTGLTGLNGCDT